MSRPDAAPGAPPRRRIAAALLGLTQLGHAHWFFGNLYEAVVKVPDRLASHDSPRGSERAMSPLGPRSPVRYYAAAAPATSPAVIAAAVLGWDNRSSRPWLVTAVTCSILGSAATAYLVRAINLKLFFSAEPLAAAEQEVLLRRWYRVNAVRLVLAATASASAHQAKSRLLP